MACALSLWLTGCANTSLTARIDPETAGRHISKVMVRAEYASLNHRQTAEDALCAELAKVSAWSCVTYGRVIWYASANANGTIFADWKDLIAATAKQTARELMQSGLSPAK